MGNPYQSQSISGYNANPPDDDGSQVAANQLEWSKHKTKLGDPIKTLAEGMNTEVLAAFGKLAWYAERTISSSDTVVLLDERKLLSCTNSITITLIEAASAGAGFTVTILNAGSGTITIDGDGTETINGALTRALATQYDAVVLFCDGSNWLVIAEHLGAGAAGTTLQSDGTIKSWVAAGLPRSYLAGLALSNGTDATNDIDIAVGKCRDAADSADLAVATAIGKQLDASWAAGGTTGTPTGGLSSSLTLTNDTTYHAILGKVSGTEEVGFDTSITGANLVTDHSFTNTRRIGSVLRGTATNVAFIQDGDRFSLSVPVNDVSAANPGTSAVTRTLTVPIGIEVQAKFHAAIQHSNPATACAGLFTELDQADTAPASNTIGQLQASSNALTHTDRTSTQLILKTNTSGQVRSRLSFSDASVTLFMTIEGWIDRRGRDD